MGCRQSAKVVTLEEKYEKLHVQEEVSDAFRILNIDKKRGESYYRVFVDMDADGGGDVDVDEFHEYMEILRTPFSDMAFFSLDQDDNSGLGFVEVVSGVWSICTASESVLVSLAFSLYDADGSGVLDLAECTSLLKMIYDTNELTDQIQKILIDMDEDGDGEYSKDEFTAECTRTPALLQPVLDLQLKVRKKVFGVRYWKKPTKWRVENFGALTVDSILYDEKRRLAKLEEERKLKEEEEEERFRVEKMIADAKAKKIADKRAEAKQYKKILENATREQREYWTALRIQYEMLMQLEELEAGRDPHLLPDMHHAAAARRHDRLKRVYAGEDNVSEDTCDDVENEMAKLRKERDRKDALEAKKERTRELAKFIGANPEDEDEEDEEERDLRAVTEKRAQLKHHEAELRRCYFAMKVSVDNNRERYVNEQKRIASERAQHRLKQPEGNKMVVVDAKRLAWTYGMLPKVDDYFEPLPKLKKKEARVEIRRLHVLEKMQTAEDEATEVQDQLWLDLEAFAAKYAKKEAFMDRDDSSSSDWSESENSEEAEERKQGVIHSIRERNKYKMSVSPRYYAKKQSKVMVVEEGMGVYQVPPHVIAAGKLRQESEEKRLQQAAKRKKMLAKGPPPGPRGMPITR